MKRSKRNSEWPGVIDIDPKGDSRMTGSKLTIAGVALLLVVALVGVTVVYANIKYAQEGTVQVVTYFGHIERVYRPQDGWFTTLAPGRASHEVNVRSFTEKTGVRVTSKDNAALNVEIAVTAHTDPQNIEGYVRKYGFSERERHERRNEIVHGLVQTEARNAFSEYPAYEVYANQEEIQKRIIDALRPQLQQQLMQILESVQIGNPDFLDDGIERAASEVVANEKQKQAEQAKFEAAKIAAQTKQIEAQTYANPALLEIKKLELQLEIERARAQGMSSHQGPLTIMYGTPNTTVQIPAGR
jgi:SPFH domain / Band 7 family